MWKLAVAIGAVFLWGGTAAAKSNHVGFRGGVNVSTLKGDQPADVESVVRPMGGVVGVFDLVDELAFQFELLWSGKGTEGTIPIELSSLQAVIGTVKLDYLEIPLLLRFTPSISKRWRPYLYGGPGVAANLSATASGRFGDGTPLPDSWDDGIDEIITDGDLLLLAGGGLGVESSKLLLEIDARYSSGLVTVDESRFSAEPKNRTWAFSLAVLFRLGE